MPLGLCRNHIKRNRVSPHYLSEPIQEAILIALGRKEFNTHGIETDEIRRSIARHTGQTYSITDIMSRIDRLELQGKVAKIKIENNCTSFKVMLLHNGKDEERKMRDGTISSLHS